MGLKPLVSSPNSYLYIVKYLLKSVGNLTLTLYMWWYIGGEVREVTGSSLTLLNCQHLFYWNSLSLVMRRPSSCISWKKLFQPLCSLLLDGWLIIKILRYVLWNERGSVCQCGLFTFMMACLISDEGCLKLDSSMYCHQFNSI